MKRPDEKQKILILVAAATVLILATVIALGLNYHSLFVYSEGQGWFKTPVAIEKAEPQGSARRTCFIEEMAWQKA